MSSSSLLATKILLISSGVILLAMMMKLTIIPWLINFTMSELPIIWSFLVSLCKPPYLYVIINAIIITIVASSRFTRTETETDSNLEHFRPLISARTPPRIETQHDMFVAASYVVEKGEVAAAEVVVESNDEEVEEERVEIDEGALVREMDVPREQEVVLPVRRKARGLSRFGPPKPPHATPKGKSEVTTEESINRQDQEVTLESMWNMIMEGREKPFDQSMKKSELLDDYTRKVDDERPLNEPSASTPTNSQFPKTSFKGRATYLCESPVKSWILKKEPSLGQEELNRRADAFIQKFNEEMRMQRQQSLMQKNKTGNNFTS
ncbi:hypothetical protein Leryth_019613 [Lithospermum erythrorhizon]|nr:hypothetical protein Leryth_019613 [Lithospermum erythrorhizon]